MDKLNALLAALRTVLTGEPLRFIGYGAIVVVWIVARVLVAMGKWTEPPDLNTICLAVTAAVAAVTEFARRYVYSPNSVVALVAGAHAAPVTPLPTDPAQSAGA